jgi:glycolate oxidase
VIVFYHTNVIQLLIKKGDSMETGQLVAALAAGVQSERVLFREQDTAPYECDGLTMFKAKPKVVVLPETRDEVCHVLKTCKSLGVPVVARGAGTGLSGGALPHADGVLLVMSKFSKILEIDEEARIARVEPGVRNLAISEAVSHLDLYYAPDPSSQIACSIGGNIAENSGGVHCLKYGLTVHNVLSVTIALDDGSIVTVGSDALDSPGYDLLALTIGSEGLLAVVLEITVRLLPKPEEMRVVMAAFDDVTKAGDSVGNIIAAGIIPAGLEMMDGPAVAAVEDFVKAGYPLDAEALLLCEVDGTKAEVADELARVEAILKESGATMLRIASNEEERLLFWKGRKSAFPAVGRISPDYYCMDGTIPRKHLSLVLRRMREMSERYGLRCANVFHAGDGNLHPLILFDANNPAEVKRAEDFGAEILELSVEVGGTITGEHGVGVEKINEMCVQFSSDELTQFHSMKAAFDPTGILNPGKAVPTLSRCAEFGKMHIHHGQMPHPELERF